MNVYTPEILKDKAQCEALGIDGSPMFAVLGKPVAHSKSPPMQNVAIAHIDGKGSHYTKSKYFAFEVAPENLGEALELFAKRNFRGLNLTIPHKEVAFGLLKDFDRSAEIAGACNTLKLGRSGWKGYNTDGFGFERAVKTNFSLSVKNADVVILGAGGAARGTIFYLLSRGIKSLTIANRSRVRLDALFGELYETQISGKISRVLLSDERLYASIRSRSVIVNATSVGLNSSDAPIIDFAKVPSGCVFFDMPYVEGDETASVKAARQAGLRASSGLAMLAWQGAKSLSIWTGRDVEKLGKIMLEALSSAGKNGA